MVKKILFLLCLSSLFGFRSPLSGSSEKKLKKGISLLENGEYDFLYISMDNFDFDEKDQGFRYVQKMLSNLEQEVAEKIYVTHSPGNFEGSFMRFIYQKGCDAIVGTLGSGSERKKINARINQAVSNYPGAGHPYRQMPKVIVCPKMDQKHSCKKGEDYGNDCLCSC